MLAVEAGDEIGNVDAGDEPLRGGCDNRVGDLEPLYVGDHLQVRKVKRDQYQILIASHRARRRIEIGFETVAVRQAGHLVGDDRDLEFGLQLLVGFDSQGQFASAAEAVERHADPQRDPCGNQVAPSRRQGSGQPAGDVAERAEPQFFEQQKNADARHGQELDFCASGFHDPSCPQLTQVSAPSLNSGSMYIPNFMEKSFHGLSAASA